ncbi:MAG: hypothetical protein GY724_29635 [Actinomycetia bacterium]|nr:hypothetical protein [Actinomycetes bacterium]
MNRRVLGLAVAVVLAALGTVALVGYVRSAEERALSDEQLVEVLVVTKPIEAGSLGADIEGQVTTEAIPVKVQAVGAVASLEDVSELVVAVDLVPGEQLVTSRFVASSAFTEQNPGVVIPDDMVEVTIELGAARAVGGLLLPGQHVAVIASFEPFDLASPLVSVDGEVVALPSAVAGGVAGKTPNVSEIIIHRALVTAVQEIEGGQFEDGSDRASTRLNEAPSNPILVTLALSPVDAERVVFSLEFGELWLAREQATVPDDDGPITNYDEVLDSGEGL